LYPDGKKRAMPSLYRDYLLAKERTWLPVLRQATPTNFIAGPLYVIDCLPNKTLEPSPLQSNTFENKH